MGIKTNIITKYIRTSVGRILNGPRDSHCLVHTSCLIPSLGCWWANTCDEIIALFIRLHYIRLPCCRLERVGIQSLFDDLGNKVSIHVVNYLVGGHMVRKCDSLWELGAVPTWQPARKRGASLLYPQGTELWINHISFKEGPDFPMRTSVWPTLDCSQRRPWAWPEQDPVCLDRWPMKTVKW